MRTMSMMVVALMSSTALHAQTVPPSTGNVPTPAAEQNEAPQGSMSIEDIVVTAQRREQKLQSVPIAVTTVTSSQLSNSGVASTQDLAALTPALSVSNLVGSFMPRIRGIGSNLTSAGIENSVATYIDGVYIASAPAGLISLSNIDRVEVLKGPQGTLFGRNATGGLIQIVTKKPSETFGGMLSGSYGNYDTYGFDGYVTGGLAPGLALDFAGHSSFQGDGYGRNLALGIDTNKLDHDIALRSQLAYERDTTSIRISVDYSDTTGSQGELRDGGTELPVFGPNVPSNRPWDSNGDTPYRVEAESAGASVTINQELGFANLVSITAYRETKSFSRIDVDATPVDAVVVQFAQREKQFSQELQLVSKPSSPVSWLVGAFYFADTARNVPFSTILGPPAINPAMPIQQIDQFNTQRTRSGAVFGQVTVPVGEATNVTAGLRYTTERRRFSGEQLGTLTTGAVIPLASLAGDAQTYNKLTWRFSVDHKFTPDVMAYASVNRGFKSGGYNQNGGLLDPPYQPETLDAYEIGLKADLFDKRFRFNPSIFYYDYKNIQVTAFGGNATPRLINGPKARIYGLDLDFVAIPFEHLTLRGGATFLHDRFLDFPGAVFRPPNTPPARGSALLTGNAKGNRLPYTSDWVLTFAADYVVPLDQGKLTLSATYNHNDGYFTETDNIRRQGAYNLVNASVRIDMESGLFAALWAKNLTNEAIALYRAAADTGSGVSYQPPRTYGVTAGIKF